jgi:transposase-like protein
VESIAPKIGCVPQTLLVWVKRQEVDTGVREGVTTTETQRVRGLEREVKELCRGNEILKLASAFSAQAAPYRIAMSLCSCSLERMQGGCLAAHGRTKHAA